MGTPSDPSALCTFATLTWYVPAGRGADGVQVSTPAEVRATAPATAVLLRVTVTVPSYRVPAGAMWRWKWTVTAAGALTVPPPAGSVETTSGSRQNSGALWVSG